MSRRGLSTLTPSSWARMFGLDGQSVDPSIPKDEFSSPGFVGPTPGGKPHHKPVTAPDAPPAAPPAASSIPGLLDSPHGPDLGDPLIAGWAMHSEPNALFAAIRCWNGLQANSITSRQHDQAKNLINAMWIEATSGDDGNKNAKRFISFWDKIWNGGTGGSYQYG